MATVDISKERLELSKANTMLDDIHFSMPKTFTEPSLHCCDIIWLRPIAISEDPAVYAFDTGSSKAIQISQSEPSHKYFGYGGFDGLWTFGDDCDGSVVVGPDPFSGWSSNIYSNEVPDGYQTFDWFMVPLATLSMYPQVIYNLLPAKEDFSKSYAGMFKIRFYNGGKWVEILIDDRVPFHSCTDDYTPYFVTSESGYWLPLVLKAFAKFHGSYERLMSGSLEDAYQALTSGVTEIIQLNELKPKFHISFTKYFDSACVMTLKCIYNKDTTVHTSYFVIVDLKIKDPKTLVSIKKPSDILVKLKYVFSVPQGQNVFDIVQCQRLLKLLMNLNSRDNTDGAYWISYNDLIHTFTTLYVCNLDWGMGNLVRQPKVKLESYKFNGAWFSQNGSAHSLHDPGSIPFWSMPQFKFELREPDTYRNDTRCEFLVSLQQPGHLYNPSVELMGFFIFRLVNELERIPADFKFFSMYRPLTQVIDSGNSIRRRLKLPVGSYLIIPVAEPENHNDFYLRVYTEAKYNVWGHVSRNANVPSREYKNPRAPSKFSSSKRVSKELSVTPTPSQVRMHASLAYKDVDKQ